MRVLFATDGSPGSDYAIEEALRMLSRDDLEAHVVAVSAPSALVAAIEGVSSGVELSRAEAYFQSQVSLARAQVKLARHGILAQFHQPAGRPANEILAAAEAVQPDLLVLGSHGRGALGRFVLGSVSDDVLHHWGGATMVIRLPQELP